MNGRTIIGRVIRPGLYLGLTAVCGFVPAAPARADHKQVRAAVSFGITRAEPRRVWVPAVYEERQRVVRTEPVYELRERPVWRPPEYDARCYNVDIPPVIERCREPVFDSRGRIVDYRWVNKVERPGRVERRTENVLVREGYYRTVRERVLVEAGCEKVITERVCVREGYWANAPRDERVTFERPTAFGLSFAFHRR